MTSTRKGAMPSLEERLELLESIEAIRRLIATYALGGDRKNDPAIMRPLFTEDAQWESVGIRSFAGADAIVAGLAELGRTLVRWSIHYMISPLIDLEESRSRGKCSWYLWEPCTLTGDDGIARDTWLGGVYDAEVRREDTAWRFSRLQLELRLISANEAPWAFKKAD